MKQDWNRRARENAKWFINTVAMRQADGDFDASGRVAVDDIVRADLACLTRGRDPHSLRILEIGCGIGRMTHLLAEIFGEVYATDVSGEMVRIGAARLKGIGNVRFQETNGVDFHHFPDDLFDVILSAYVYQHVPEAQVIRTNLADAYRVLKPGGVFKFQTNGVTNGEFRQTHKDTWTGDSFPEQAVRVLAAEIGAQMVRIQGAETQYCWTLWRKPCLSTSTPITCSPRLETVVPTPETAVLAGVRADDGIHLDLVVSDLDPECVDVNTVRVVIAGQPVAPWYAGPVLAPRHGSHDTPVQVSQSAVQIGFAIPSDTPPGPQTLCVRLATGTVSDTITLRVPAPAPARPCIVYATNADDGGLDIYARGCKSRVRLYLSGVHPASDLNDLQIAIGNRVVVPEQVIFVPGNGLYMAVAQLPPDTLSGLIPASIRVCGVDSLTEVLHVIGRDTPRPVRGIPALVARLGAHWGGADA